MTEFRNIVGPSVFNAENNGLTPGNYPNLYDSLGRFIGVIDANGVEQLLTKITKKTPVLRRKFFGNTVSATTASNTTESVKLALECDYDAIQIGFLSALATATTWKAAIAATETAAIDTQTNMFTPVSGGVSKNSLDASTEVGGWRDVKFSGAATGDTPINGSLDLPTLLLSDWIPLSSIPRADGGNLPLLMIKAYANGSITPYSFIAGVSGQHLLMAQENTTNKNRIVQIGSVAGDGVTTLATMPTALSHSFSPLLVVNYRARKKGVTVAFVGDSITENNALVTTTKFTSWGYRACALASNDSGIPVEFMNLGYSGKTQTTFLASLKNLLAIKPDIAFFSAWSPNDPDQTTQRSYDDEAARTQDFLTFCLDNDIIPVLTTPVPNDSASAGVDTLRRAYGAKIRSLCSDGQAYLCDFQSAGMGDNANPEKWLTQYKFDNTHPNELAIDTIMAPLAASVIQKLM